MVLKVYVYVKKNITTMFKLWRSMKVTTCTTAILADVFLLLRYMYFSIIYWAIQLSKVGLDGIIVYTLYNNHS